MCDSTHVKVSEHIQGDMGIVIQRDSNVMRAIYEETATPGAVDYVAEYFISGTLENRSEDTVLAFF